VEYVLTELGVEVGQLTGAIAEWSFAHATQILAARTDFDAREAAPPQPL
jgi:DNA-binding HxlR family transcriptional regulator